MERQKPISCAAESGDPKATFSTENEEFRQLKSDFLCEFFELAIHAVLYYRELYPASFFQRKKKYQIPVWVAVHPSIGNYVENFINGIKSAIFLGKINAIAIVILDPVAKIPVEKFVFRISNFDEKDRKISSENEIFDDFLSPSKRNKFLFRFGEALKAFSLRIAASKSYLKPLPPNCTCVLQITTDSRTQLAMAEEEESKRFPWVEVDSREEIIHDGQIQSVRGPTDDVCPLEMYVEEAKNKFAPIFRKVQPISKE